jgi:SAM-dependent methyltransferase
VSHPHAPTLAFALALALAACGHDSGARADQAGADSVVPLAPAGTRAEAFPAPRRRVAPITADIWSNEASRDAAGEADTVMNALGIGPGWRVADVGAGSGYFTARLARRVGPSGRVYAEDIVPEVLRVLAARVRRERLDNVSVGRGDPHDPRLPPRSVDVALLVNMYHEVEQPFGLMYNLVPALRPGGRVAIVDSDRETWAHGTPRSLLACELAAVGYEEVMFRRLTDGAYLAVFRPPTAGALPDPDDIDVSRCAA